MAAVIEVQFLPTEPDAAGEGLLKRLGEDINLTLDAVRVVDVYKIDKELTPEQLERLRLELFTNSLTQQSAVNRSLPATFDWAVEVGFLPGVTDNVGRTSREAVSDLLGLEFQAGEAVYSAKRYLLSGSLNDEQVKRVAGYLANPLIQSSAVKSYTMFQQDGGMGTPTPKTTLPASDRVDLVDLDLSEEALIELGKAGIPENGEANSAQRRGPLALDLESMKVIKDYFDRQGRKPTDVELESLAQTWSEHCKHTIFANPLDEVESLYKTYIKGSTEAIRKELGQDDWLVSVFSDNSGVIRFTEDQNLCYKVETHNSPSALDPYGGAITGIVGVNRDALGTGTGARLVTNMYGFCFADPYYDKQVPFRDEALTKPILYPKTIFEGVRLGVEHGGNKSGIPTSFGFISFDNRYMGKPLVFVGTVGLMPTHINGKPTHEKKAEPGDVIVMVGGRIGKDGIHGATFSSESLHAGSPAGAVQIGDPITQKKMGDAQLEARDLGLFRSITDCGAGGISCSVGEMAKESGGCLVDLDKAPIKYPGITPNEIWISESQERMTFAVQPENEEAFLDLMHRRGVEATVIGTFTDSGRCVVNFNGKTVMDVELDFLHDGLPTKQLETTFTRPVHEEPAPAKPESFGDALQAMAARLNLCSREYVVRQYDHEVLGGSVIKPLIGQNQDVHADASVTRPILDRVEGFALGGGILPSYGDIDTYEMAACAVDTAVRNVVAAGADPKRIALLDNTCWCSSTEAERLGQLKRAMQATYDITVAYKTPLISGKDSMFNDFKGFDEHGKPVKISVPPTLLISSIGVVPDVRHSQTLDFKAPGDSIYILGKTYDELGGSEYYAHRGEQEQGRAYIGNTVPKVRIEDNLALYAKVAEALKEELFSAIHSLQQGGLAMGLCRMGMAGDLGAGCDLAEVSKAEGLSLESLLFSESQGRFLVSVPDAKKDRMEALFAGLPCHRIGQVMDGDVLALNDATQPVAQVSLAACKRGYKKTLGW